MADITVGVNSQLPDDLRQTYRDCGDGTYALVRALADNDGVTIGDVNIAAGTNIIGSVGIDQTTPGTTDSVTVSTGQGAGATIGTTTGTKVITDAAGTLQQYLRGIVHLLISIITVKIDQTTPGTTNKVAIRTNGTATATIANGANLSGVIDFREYSMMTIHMPAAWTAAFIGFTVSTTSGGTFLPLYDENGNLVQTATAVINTAIAAPPELAGCRYVKLWSQNGAGTLTAQGAERVLLLDLKA